MKLELKDFQTDASQRVRWHMAGALAQAANGTASAIILASPTGSGKTIIATDIIERTLIGNEDSAPDAKAVFLWVTDQPELNIQTRRKIADASSLKADRLEIIETTFDQETLTPGHLYFINTQKLGEGSLLIRPGDGRAYTFWQTLANTIADKSIRLYVVIDEAHRGMVEDKERALATSITQKFIKGSSESPAVPVVIGVSATIGRFQKLLEGTNRVQFPWIVSAVDVRESGLIKSRVVALCTDETQPSDMTMLREATKAWRAFVDGWATYGYREDEELVRPIMLIQVEDGTDHIISKTNLEAVIAAVREEAGIDLPAEAFAHAFDIDDEIPVGKTMRLRHLRPSEIESDPDVQVVIFKTSLNVGWDCPRAETMMSFRKANDPTNIAQLVGRMVRAPLTHAIEENDHLNSVSLYLPHYNSEELTKIVAYLSESGEAAAATDISTSRTVTLAPAAGMEDSLAALGQISNSVIPLARKTTQVRRLLKLARQLALDGIDDDVEEYEKQGIVALLAAEHTRLLPDPGYKAVIEERGALVMKQADWLVGSTSIENPGEITVPVSRENIDDLFAGAGRKLGEGLHLTYAKFRSKSVKNPYMTSKLEVTALVNWPDVGPKLEDHARKRVAELLDAHQAAIKVVADASKSEYHTIRGLSTAITSEPFQVPGKIDVPTAETTMLTGHVFDDGNGQAPMALGTWEIATLLVERERKDAIGWLRNFPRQHWSFVVAYEHGGETKRMYPDFLFTRRAADGKVIVDLIDPHNVGLDDATDKAIGMAKYAREHGSEFGRIELVMLNGETLHRIDLKDEVKRSQVMSATSSAHLKAVFGL